MPSRTESTEATPMAVPIAPSDLCFMSARELEALIGTRKVSAREVMAAHLKQIHRVNPTMCLSD